ncbi:MAG: hypothetical protein VCA55_06175 [Verrucomicrobiales bacterium]
MKNAGLSVSRGFSLIEIVITVGILATVVVSLVGILPVGIKFAEDAANRTVLAVILEDVHNRLEGQLLEPGEVSLSPFFYDRQGLHIGEDSDEEVKMGRLYRADARLIDIAEGSRLKHTSGLMAVRIDVRWPVDTYSGVPLRKGKPQETITFYVTPLTGSDWPAIDTNYRPKIEF